MYLRHPVHVEKKYLIPLAYITCSFWGIADPDGNAKPSPSLSERRSPSCTAIKSSFVFCKNIAYAALDGAIEGIIIAIVPESVILFAGHQFIETMTACGNSGLDPIWCYTFAFAASAATFGLPSTGDDLTDIFVDTTFGMAETLIVDGSITAAQNASSSNNPNAGASDPHTMPHAAGHGISTVWKNHNVALLN